MHYNFINSIKLGQSKFASNIIVNKKFCTNEQRSFNSGYSCGFNFWDYETTGLDKH